MSHQWRGVLHEYRDRLDVTDATPIITLGEGGTPLIPAPALEALPVVRAVASVMRVEGEEE